MSIWTSDDIMTATGGKCSAIFGAKRVHIDSRTIQPGDLFVPIKGEHFDGHQFIAQAFQKGAAAALVSIDNPLASVTDQPVVVVNDTLRALHDLAAYNRKRRNAFFIGVTGSVGKTSTKEMLKLALGSEGAVYATAGNFNNHIGLPLMLANMPRTAQFGVFEIGMNHSGEIAPLSRLLRPHVAVITTVEPVHLEFFASLGEIADAKAEIMEGLKPGGTLVLNRDNSQFEHLLGHAGLRKIDKVVSFGEDLRSNCKLLSYTVQEGRSWIEASLGGETVSYALHAVGKHWALLSLAVLAACRAVGEDIAKAAAALEDFSEGEGRGKLYTLPVMDGHYTLVDDCYNASPASMNAAFARLRALAYGHKSTRVVAVLGDMLELGTGSPQLHTALAEGIRQNGVDRVYACGPLMKHLYETLPGATRGAYEADSAGLLPMVKEALRPGDLVLIKGSNGSKMKVIRDALTNAV